MVDLMDMLGRLGMAVLVGGLVGMERRIHGRWADLRTYVFVSVAAAIFVIIGEYALPGDHPDVSRIIQGIATGVGFLGAGTILKLSDQVEIKGITTASSIWLAAALGTASGLRLYLLALVGAVLSLLVLIGLRPVEKKFP
jgi:putative Mg2+ transporter-C (MgtC) family protein